jgi:hypothetical protein
MTKLGAMFSFKRKPLRSNQMSEDERILQLIEYADIIVTLRLAWMLNPDKPNTAIKRCAISMKEHRITSPNVQDILGTIINTTLPLAQLTRLIRSLEVDESTKWFVFMEEAIKADGFMKAKQK